MNRDGQHIMLALLNQIVFESNPGNGVWKTPQGKRGVGGKLIEHLLYAGSYSH